MQTLSKQESRTIAREPRDAAVNFDTYRIVPIISAANKKRR